MRNKKPTLPGEETMKTPRTCRSRAICCREGKTTRESRKERTHNIGRTGDITKEISKETKSGNGTDNKMDVGKWETVFFTIIKLITVMTM